MDCDNDLFVQVFAEFEGFFVFRYADEVAGSFGVFFFDVEDGAEYVLVVEVAFGVFEREVGVFLWVGRVVGVVVGVAANATFKIYRS